jgi:hypothetical protein
MKSRNTNTTEEAMTKNNTMRLTESQIRTLGKLHNSEHLINNPPKHFDGTMADKKYREYRFANFVGAHPDDDYLSDNAVHTASAKALEKKGLVELRLNPFNGNDYRDVAYLTDEGRARFNAYLERHDIEQLTRYDDVPSLDL